MAVQLRLEGLFKGGQFDAWQRDTHMRMRAGAVAGMKEGGTKIRDELRANMRSAFRIRRSAFVNVMNYRVYAERAERLPAMLVGAIKAPWLESHEIGATVRGRGRGLLIPLFGRIGRKRFRAMVTRLIKQGNAFFKEVNGRVILFAENLKESGADLARFKRGVRRGIGGGRIKRSAEIPIAVLVPNVKLRPRLKIQATVRRAIPRVLQAIENSMRLR
jgi:hypothetical protein